MQHSLLNGNDGNHRNIIGHHLVCFICRSPDGGTLGI